MNQRIAHAAIIVDDYDKAIKFYTDKLNFKLIEDTKLSDTKRWVLVSPEGAGGFSLLLAKASDKEQESRIGNQTGGRVFLFLHTDDFSGYFNKLVEGDVQIIREPATQPWGRVAVFADLYGNQWDLIEKVNIVS